MSLCHFETIHLENCPTYFKINFHGLVDDTFLLFWSNYLSKFILEIEENFWLSFFGYENQSWKQFVKSAYHKPTSSHFHFIELYFTEGLDYALIMRT